MQLITKLCVIVTVIESLILCNCTWLKILPNYILNTRAHDIGTQFEISTGARNL